MRPRDRLLAEKLDANLLHYDQATRALPGIQNLARRDVFIEQILESIRRIEYVSLISTRKLSSKRADPNEEIFDPLKAAILYKRQHQIDEAFWMVFLFVHFGKNARGGWRYAREVYSGLSDSIRWDWASVSGNPADFREWLDIHQDELKREGVPGGFGNHRKYESLDAYSRRGTGEVVESYVGWVNPPRTHKELFDQACEQTNGDPRQAFDILYQSMDAVTRFGRMARFDYLTMVGKVGLAPIEPGSTYIHGSTGPLRGAQLLFGNHPTEEFTPKDLDCWLIELGAQLNVGMQVLEDAICNWQKSPDVFVPFRG